VEIRGSQRGVYSQSLYPVSDHASFGSTAEPGQPGHHPSVQRLTPPLLDLAASQRPQPVLDRPTPVSRPRPEVRLAVGGCSEGVS
jgi:hypothetical protein